jgi:hypothetical protein
MTPNNETPSTGTPGTGALTALDLVVDDPAKATESIASALDATGALDAAGDADPALVRAAKHLRHQIAEHIRGILAQIPVADILAGGWQHLDKVGEAKRETASTGERRTISVFHHELKARHDPQVQLVVDHVPVPLLKLLFDTVFVIDPSVLDIEAGEIVHATPGPISAKAVLSTSSVTLIERVTPKLDVRRIWSDELAASPEPEQPAAQPAAPEPTKSNLSF